MSDKKIRTDRRMRGGDERFSFAFLLVTAVILIGGVAIAVCQDNDCATTSDGFQTDGGIEWQKDDTSKTLTIRPATNPKGGYASGVMRDYTEVGPWDHLVGTTEHWTLNIQSGVTRIGNYAFNGCGSIESEWALPDSVKEIGNYAFSLCSGYKGNLDIRGVEKIGEKAFDYCRGFQNTSIVIPYGIELGDYAFDGCTGIAGRLELPCSMTEVGKGVFSHCGNITDLDIPGTVTEIGYEAFSGCSGIKKIDIPNSVTKIGISAFSQVGIEGKLTIPNSVGTIGSGAFSGCGGITELDLPNSLKAIESNTFSVCVGIKGTVAIPNSVTEIGEGAFMGCTGIENLDLSSVEKIGKRAFMGCTGIDATLVIPASVTNIGGAAFQNCVNVAGIVFLGDQPSFTGSGGWASFGLNNESGTKEYKVYSNGWVDSSTFGDVSIGEKITKWNRIQPSTDGGISWIKIDDRKELYVIKKQGGTGVMNDYDDTGPWTKLTESGWTLHLGEGVKNIGNKAFNGSSGLIGTVVLPGTVTEIGDNAFAGCMSLVNIVSNETDPTKISAGTDMVEEATKIFVPADSNSSYKEQWGSYKSQIYSYIDKSKAIPYYIYDGSEHSCFNNTHCEMVQNKETDAGTYDARVTPADGFLWSDGTGTMEVTAHWEIAKRTVVVSGITAQDKYYDGNTDATLVYDGVVISGKVAGDDLSVTAKGAFETAEIGSGKIVYITDITLLGDKAKNYVLALTGNQTQTTAAILENGFIVMFLDEDGNKVSDDVHVKEGGTVKEPTLNLPEGKVIAGWYLAKVLWDFDEDTIEGDTTLVVKISTVEAGKTVVDASDRTAVNVEPRGVVTDVTVVLKGAVVTVNGLSGSDALMIEVLANDSKFDVRVTLGDAVLKDKPITMSVPYDVSKGIHNLYRYTESGEKVLVEASFDASTGMVTFTALGDATYGIEYGDEPVPPGPVEPTSGGGFNYVLLIVFILAVLFTLYVGLISRD